MNSRNIANAKRYNINETFADCDVINHKTFGLGAGIQCLADNKIQVLFQDGSKILVHAR